jgi:hypothetical protein
MISNRIIKWVYGLPDFYKFLTIILITIGITYYSSAPIRITWYVIVSVLYYFSRNEALWLAFFLCTVDGFAGFFGLYEVTLNILPGLPAIELAQIYVVLSVIKAAIGKNHGTIFYTKYLQILFLYLIFQVVWGQMMGFTGELKVYFRVLKEFIPMLLFFSIPRLFANQEMYERFFRIMFYVVLLAFAAQIFTLFTGLTPMEAVGAVAGEKSDENPEFRYFYNASSTLLGLFGALYFLNRDKIRLSDRILFLSVTFAALLIAVLSATRGWIIGFSFIIIAAFIFTDALRSKRSLGLILFAVPFVIWTLTNPVIYKQIAFGEERFNALTAIKEGDLSAEGTLQRLDYRSQRVMAGWKDNSIFGWGLSDKGFDYRDDHVGNQSLLVTSGIVGFVLLNGFLIYFSLMILNIYYKSAHRVRYRNSLLVFLIFLAGWFLIHSTSGQQFNFTGIPVKIIPQAVFFSFGAFQYERLSGLIHEKKI